MKLTSRILGIAVLVLALQACMNFPHGGFGAISTQKLKDHEPRADQRVKGAHCGEWYFFPTVMPQAEQAVGRTMGNADGTTDVITDAEFIYETYVRFTGGGSCVTFDAEPVAIKEGSEQPTARPEERQVVPEAGGWNVVGFDGGRIGTIARRASDLQPTSTGGRVSGDSCTWALLFIPLNKFGGPDLDEAIDEAIAAGAPGTNVITDANFNAKAKIFLAINAMCYEISGTPARSEMLTDPPPPED